MPRAKKPPVEYLKLGKHKAWGFAYEDGRIQLDERLLGLPRMQILIHEWLHVAGFWADELEPFVDEVSRELAKFLHHHGARMIEPGDKPLALSKTKKPRTTPAA